MLAAVNVSLQAGSGITVVIVGTILDA